jgi:hypothetical protein
MAEEQPKKKKSRKGLWITLAVVGFAIIGMASMNSADKNTNSSTPSNTASQNTNAKKDYAVGEDARVGDVRWKLISARDRGTVLKASESRYAVIAKNKTTTGKFIEITMEVENLGTDMKTVTNLKLVDAKNREYTNSSDTSEWAPEGKDLFLLSNLNPNVPQQFVGIYEVPADATGLKVKVGDLNLFGNKEATISLGV